MLSARPMQLECIYMGGTPVTSVLAPYILPTLMVLPSGKAQTLY